MTVSFDVTGLDAVMLRIRSLQAKAQKSITRKAARKAMNIVRDEARSNAKLIDDPATAEKIFKNIVTEESGKQGQKLGGIVMRVGVKGGASNNQHSKDKKKFSGGDTTYWRYIEFGTSYTPAVPFMRPALAKNISKVSKTFVDEFVLGVNEAMRT